MSVERPVIGLTGGIGSGKSSALRFLVALGAEGIDADRVARAVTAPDGPAYRPVMAEFGTGLLAADGQVDRRRLAERVFGDPVALARLEAIVHPAVAEVIQKRVAASTAPLVVIEAIKLLEAGLSRQLCDQVWVTVARRAQQVARLTVGRGMPAAEIERRLAAQMPPEQMAAQANRVIDTSGTLAETGLQMFAGWRSLGLAFPAAQLRPVEIADAEGVAAVLNGIVREGGLTVVDRTYTVDEEKLFLAGRPSRAYMTVATVAGLIVAFQEIAPYTTETGAMDHVASMGTFVAAPLRGQGLGHTLSAATFAQARAMGYSKIVIYVRADNPHAQAFYNGLGFRECGRLASQAYVDGHFVDEILYELFL